MSSKFASYSDGQKDLCFYGIGNILTMFIKSPPLYPALSYLIVFNVFISLSSIYFNIIFPSVPRSPQFRLLSTSGVFIFNLPCVLNVLVVSSSFI
jgi:hypothetical protein